MTWLSLSRPSPLSFGLFLFVVAALVAAPVFAGEYLRSFLLVLFMYVAMALSWNMLSGYTGYLSFGQGVFFGIGVYAFALLVTKLHVPFALALVVAGIAPALIAAALGLVFMRVRIRVAYFSLATLGLNEIVKTLVTGAGWLGGNNGMTLPPPSSPWLLYYLGLATTLLTFAVAACIDRSTFGLGLRAILQDEEAAEATGVPTYHCKLLVFTLSAIFPGLFGAIIGWHWSYVDPTLAFDLSISFDMAVMTLFGGVGTLWGPIIGATIMGSLAETLWVYVPNLHGLMYGLLVFAMVVLAPGGIMELGQRLQPYFRRSPPVATSPRQI
jgi:branched-chain amino acid transport system permease protein